MYKLQIYENLKEDIINSFKNFCQNYIKIIPEPFNEYPCCTKIIENLREDYFNFYQNEKYQLKFIYPYKIFVGNKSLKDNKYKKLLESNYTEEEKIYFIINSELKKIFNRLDAYIDNTKYKTNLSAKQLFNYSYFIDTQPRCCFCGQLLESSINEKNEEYLHADIEHIIPKDQFPQFTLHPVNWAPCCKECNMGEKGTSFFEGNSPQEKIDEYKSVINTLGLKYNELHPLKLWNNYQITYNNSLNININNNYKKNKNVIDFFNFYGIENRIKVIASRCYNILFNIIQHSDIRSPESLERLLENMASTNWHEINDGYSLNNSPQIWKEFIENILYDKCKLIALWDEVKSMNMSIF